MNELQKEIHEHNVKVGWWDDADINTKFVLVISELMEALEGDRKNLMDDKLPHRKMLEVELADALIRMLDIGGYHGWDATVTSNEVDEVVDAIGEDYSAIPFCLLIACDVVLDVYKDHLITYKSFIVLILAMGKYFNLDIMGALHEKREYNATRADHTRENRATTHGKKY